MGVGINNSASLRIFL